MPDELQAELPADTGQDSQLSTEGGASERYGKNFRDIPEDWKKWIADRAKKFAQEDEYARLLEVKEAARQRLYYRSEQQLIWSSRDNTFLGGNTASGTGQTYGGYGGSGEDDGPRYMRSFNIYTPLTRALSAALSENFPGVRFEPADPSDSMDIEAAATKNIYRKAIEREADLKATQREICRLWGSDGRVGVYAYSSEDGRTYGESESGPGNDNVTECFDAYGMLETKVPILVQRMRNWPYLIVSEDLPTIWLKGEYDWIDKDIQGSSEVTLGEHPFSRITRLSVKQGGYSRTKSSDAFVNLTTRHFVWLQACVWEDAPDKEDGKNDLKDWLTANFPAGMKATFVGDVYAECCAENMCDVWEFGHPIEGDGQNTPSLGRPLVPVQDVTNDWMNLITEIVDYTTPKLWYDADVIDSDARRMQKSEPGAAGPVMDRADKSIPLGNSFFLEPPVDIPMALVQLLTWLTSQFAQLIVGASAALMGAPSAELGDTGIARQMSHDASQGVMGPCWASLQKMFAGIIDKGAKLAMRRKRPIVFQDQSMGGAAQIEKAQVQDLTGNTLCFPESDSSFPESWSKRRETLMWLMEQATAGNPMVLAWMQLPENADAIQDGIGLDDFVINGKASADKQLSEIQQLLKSEPIPNKSAMLAYQQAVQQAQLAGQPPPPQPPPEALFGPSIPIDPLDDNAAEGATAQNWIIGIAGQAAKAAGQESAENGKANAARLGFMNVWLHAKAHLDAVKAAAPKPQPKITTNFKDLPPSAQSVALADEGIQVSPEENIDNKLLNSKVNLEKLLPGQQHAAAQQPPTGVR